MNFINIGDHYVRPSDIVRWLAPDDEPGGKRGTVHLRDGQVLYFYGRTKADLIGIADRVLADLNPPESASQ